MKNLKKFYKQVITFLQCVFTILFICTLLSPAYGESKLEKISDNLYMIAGFGGNIAFLVAEESILIVDGGYTPSYGKQVLDIIKNVSDKPIKYVVITHYHPDHVRGIQEFLGSAKVVAHEKLASNLANFGLDKLNNDIENRYPEYITDLQDQISNYKDNGETTITELKESLSDAESQLVELKTINLVKPDISFSDSLIIEMGSEDVILHYLGPGHTSGNTIVQFKKNKTIHLGDLLFKNAFPYIDFEAGSNTENWIKMLKTVSAWGFEHIIPGHGELSGKESVEAQILYLMDLREAVSQSISMGKSLEEIKSDIKLDGYDSYNLPHFFLIGIDAVYKEMTQ